ncbi:MAG: uracil-DNA glycosylase [Gammaproteobacteria bacterium]|nr:uracil-DNA glycosylase [Gammaproteobacteria bacterium]
MSDPLNALQRYYLEAMGIQVWERCVPDQGSRFKVEGSKTGKVVQRPSALEPSPSSQTPEPAMEGVPEGAGNVGEGPDLLKPSTLNLEPVTTLDWQQLRERVAECRSCEELAACRTQTVFGVGNRDADWLIIGEAPGADEDRQGEPFVGRAGQLLNAMLRGIGLEREQVYIANILKCRPPENRDPKPEEAAACSAFLQRQIALVQPRVILAVGRIAAQNLLHCETPIGKLRGTVHRHESGVPLVVTYHPAYLLRSPLEKRKAWGDLCLARRVIREAAGQTS